ncbi:MAG TPA: aquaporin, partial [Nitrososphaerales archaeon]|nr:aquaporin [Nitrososphaerales archaeon]
MRKNFANSSLEGRRIFAEVFGTFFLVLVAAGAGVVNSVIPGSVGREAAVVAPGLMVMAIILFMGAVSGAHLNPAVSIGFALRGDFPWKRVPGYILAQLLGATLACLFLWLLFGNVGMLGATLPGPNISDLQALSIELVLTL